MNKVAFDVLGVGCAAVDFLGSIPHFPEPDVKLPLLEFKREGGGPTATAMVTLARLGAKAAFLGKVGDTEFGKFILDELNREGVNTEYTVTAEDGTNYVSFVLTDRRERTRTILYYREGTMNLRPEEIDRKAIGSSRLLHLDQYEPEAALAAAEYAKDEKVEVVIDVETVNAATRRLIELADIIIVPCEFACSYTEKTRAEDAAAVLHAMHGGKVVVTAGEEDAVYMDGQHKFFQSAFSVDVVDTTGAGDVFHGAFDFAYLQGWPPQQIMEFASAVAAMKCRELGGRTGIPTLEQTCTFLAEHAGEVWSQRLEEQIRSEAK